MTHPNHHIIADAPQPPPDATPSNATTYESLNQTAALRDSCPTDSIIILGYD